MTLNKALNEYDNLLFAGDLNINTLTPTSDSSNHLSDLNDLFSLTNLVTDSTCFKSNKGSLTDLMLTNKPKSFINLIVLLQVLVFLEPLFRNFHPNL